MDCLRVFCGGGAGIFALIATGWQYIKSGFRYVSSIIISDTEINKNAASAVMSYSMKNKMKSPFGIKRYAGINSYVIFILDKFSKSNPVIILYNLRNI